MTPQNQSAHTVGESILLAPSPIYILWQYIQPNLDEYVQEGTLFDENETLLISNLSYSILNEIKRCSSIINKLDDIEKASELAHVDALVCIIDQLTKYQAHHTKITLELSGVEK